MYRSLLFVLILSLLSSVNGLAQDDLHNSRSRLVMMLRNNVNHLQRSAHQVRSDSTAAGSSLAVTLNEAVSSLMQFMYRVDQCADCESYDAATCDSLEMIRSEFGSRVGLLEDRAEALVGAGIAADSLLHGLRRVAKNLGAFLVLECGREGDQSRKP